MLRAGSGIIIVIAALHAVSALAQSERSDDRKSARKAAGLSAAFGIAR